MTSFETALNELCVLTANRSVGNGVNNQHDTNSGHPIRFIPVEVIAEESDRFQWSGNHGILYRTKTGAFVAVLTDWSCCDGSSDFRCVLTGKTAKDIYEKLMTSDMGQASSLALALAAREEVVPTL